MLSRCTITSLINLLPSAESDLWIREMTTAGLDFRNTADPNTLACFKRVCMIERNTNESYRENSNTVSSSTTSNNKKAFSSNHPLSDLDREVPVQELPAMTVKTPSSTPRLNWNPTTKLKFPCPLDNHKHEVSKCSELFNLTPLDRWEKIEKLRMCFSCLKPKTLCRGRKCSNVGSVPKFLNVQFVLRGRNQRVWFHSVYFSVNRNFMEILELSCQTSGRS